MDKAIQQHLAIEDFFTGFMIKAKKDMDFSSEKPAYDTAHGTSTHLEPLADQIRSCQLCNLHASRTHAVPGEGHPQANILFIGEAPGADEDIQGRPFVGKAGQLLERIIQACGLTREQVFITNILKCRPPGNRDPQAEEIFKCLPYLKQQIGYIQPKVIVALGAHAARTLLNCEESIGRLRGRFHDCHLCPELGPLKLMPTYHPAYLLRNYSSDNRRRVWEDMKKVLAVLDLPIPT